MCGKRVSTRLEHFLFVCVNSDVFRLFPQNSNDKMDSVGQRRVVRQAKEESEVLLGWPAVLHENQWSVALDQHKNAGWLFMCKKFWKP